MKTENQPLLPPPKKVEIMDVALCQLFLIVNKKGPLTGSGWLEFVKSDEYPKTLEVAKKSYEKNMDK